MGVQDAARSRSGVDIVVGQRHQVARRQRSRPVGLHRDQRHAVRQRGDGPDGDARRHPRLAAGRGDRRRRSTTPSDAHARRSATASRVAAFLAAHPQVSEVFHPSLPTHPDRRGDRRALRRATARCCRSASPAPTKIATRHFADVLATTRHRPLRAVVRRPGDEGEPPPDGVRVLHARRTS